MGEIVDIASLVVNLILIYYVIYLRIKVRNREDKIMWLTRAHKRARNIIQTLYQSSSNLNNQL